jgi:hypothetical protein
MESAQASKQNSSSASKGKGKAKRKTPKNQDLEELFEINSQLQDMMGRLALAQNSRQEPKPASKQCNKDIGMAKVERLDQWKSCLKLIIIYKMCWGLKDSHL